MRTSLADRLKARCEQLGMNAGQVAKLAGINRSFVYDIMRGRSEHPTRRSGTTSATASSW